MQGSASISTTARAAFLTKAKGVEEWLRDEILAGRLLPGTPLLQDEVAARLGVSSTPVREAFGVLEAEGFLERRPHRGVVVADRSVIDVADAYAVRMVLEAYAVRRVAQFADPRVLDGLEATLRDARVALSSGDSSAFRRINNTFHLALVRAANSSTLLETVSRLVPKSQVYGLADPEWMPRNHGVHEEILKALRAGDGNRAAELLTHHDHGWTPSSDA
jgi:DNA-binding GntR family transcriptional regulator